LTLNNINVNILSLDSQSTPLHVAAQSGHCDAIKLLLKSGADKTLKTAVGKTALDLAREYRDLASSTLSKEVMSPLADYEEAIKLLL
jgi:ankyrin repeat protein